MERYTVAVLVRNQFGVLNRVTSMFRRRQFNIAALTVSETESPDYSRITVLFEGENVSAKQQLIDQLYKLPDVCSIRELHKDDSVSCELLLINVGTRPGAGDGRRGAAGASRAGSGGAGRGLYPGVHRYAADWGQPPHRRLHQPDAGLQNT